MTKILNGYVVQREWGTPKISLQQLKKFGGLTPLLNVKALKEKPVITPTPPKAADIKDEIRDVLKGPIAEAKTASDQEVADQVWLATLPDGSNNPKYDNTKTEVGVRGWNGSLVLVIAYLTKKI